MNVSAIVFLYVISFLVCATSSSTDNFDTVSRTEVFVTISVLVISSFLISSFSKRVAFLEVFHYLNFQFLSGFSGTDKKI